MSWSLLSTASLPCPLSRCVDDLARYAVLISINHGEFNHGGGDRRQFRAVTRRSTTLLLSPEMCMIHSDIPRDLNRSVQRSSSMQNGSAWTFRESRWPLLPVSCFGKREGERKADVWVVEGKFPGPTHSRSCQQMWPSRAFVDELVIECSRTPIREGKGKGHITGLRLAVTEGSAGGRRGLRGRGQGKWHREGMGGQG